MYRIAICDDDRNMRDLLRSYCSEILDKYKIRYEFREFSSAEEFETDEDRDKYNLLLLDIEMSGKNGMTLAEELRRNGSRISIIFITGHDDYLKKGYSVQPIQYLFKPVKKKELESAIAADRRMNYEAESIAFNTGQKKVVLSVKKIRYAESYDHKILVHTDDQAIVLNSSLAELEQQLQAYGICRCHNSFLVNLQHISEFTRSGIVLSSGEKLPVGRRFYSDIRSAFVRYMNIN